MQVTSEDVKKRTAEIISKINRMSVPVQKATLANLRHGVGKQPGEMPELWELFLDGMPDNFGKEDGVPTKAEWAVYIAVTMYALHQQGKDIDKECMHVNDKDHCLGYSVRKLVPNEDDIDRIRKKLICLATSVSIKEVSNHLRSIIQILRANSTSIPLNYVELSGDLYNFQYTNRRKNVVNKWGKQFYTIKISHKDMKEEENSNG